MNGGNAEFNLQEFLNRKYKNIRKNLYKTSGKKYNILPSDVYLADTIDLGEPVRLVHYKLSNNFTKKEMQLRLIHKDIDIMKKLAEYPDLSPHIIKYRKHYINDTDALIETEYVAVNLSSYSNRLKWDKFHSIVNGLIEVISKAHCDNVILNNINLDNVYIKDGRGIVLTNFMGTCLTTPTNKSCEIADPRDVDYLENGNIANHIAYKADIIEVPRNEQQKITGKTDIYLLGKTLLELLENNKHLTKRTWNIVKNRKVTKLVNVLFKMTDSNPNERSLNLTNR